MRQSEILAAAKKHLRSRSWNGATMAAFILLDMQATKQDQDIGRMAFLLSRDGASENDVLGLLDDIHAWNADHIEDTNG